MLFLQGAAGNINPVSGIGAGGPEQRDDVRRIGLALAGEVIKVACGLRTHNRKGPRRVVQSVAAISVWDWENLPAACVEAFRITSRTMNLPLAPFPEQGAAERYLAERRQHLGETLATRNQGQINVARRLVAWGELVLGCIRAGVNPIAKDLEMWALRIDDLGLVAVGGEPFAELSLEVKRRSPLPNTFFLGYSNGCIGYLPTPEAFQEGGMEVEESVRNYLLPAQLTPAWGPAIIENSLEMLAQLTSTV